MIVFPHCKINLGLRILRKRADGYHDLETVFYPIPLNDVLEAVELKNGEKKSIEFTVSGAEAGEPETNLCYKAYQLLKADYPSLPPLLIHLHKTIPAGAGLGGGSADAAFTLQLLDKKFNLSLSEKKLFEYSLRLGSDCPFFLKRNPAYATGRGEILEDIPVDLSPYKIIIVNPGIHSSTAEAFEKIIPAETTKSVKQIVQQPISTWKNELINDFELSLFGMFPEIKGIKEKLYDAGALYASMSGSGSSVFGIFHSDAQPEFLFPSSYFVRHLPGSLQ
jgi:4-diphosphocytidyl-2-C-methyl-D-erythritol kinase